MSASMNQPSLAPKFLTEPRDFLIRAVEKWLQFHKGVWEQVNFRIEPQIRWARVLSVSFRVVIIVLSAGVTTISDIETVPRAVVTVFAGVLTALTGVEGFMRFTERLAEAKKQQREIEALRDELRYEWFVKVEIGDDLPQRLAAAQQLLERGPKQYNEILSKYALKAEPGTKPEVNV